MKQIYEIFLDVAEAKTRKDKMKILVDNDCVALRDIMKVNFDDDLTIHVSKVVEFKPAGLITHQSNLHELTKYLVPLSIDTYLPIERRDQIFKEILEKLHPQEAQLLIDAKNRKLKVKGLTIKLIEDVWGKRIFN